MLFGEQRNCILEFIRSRTDPRSKATSRSRVGKAACLHPRDSGSAPKYIAALRKRLFEPSSVRADCLLSQVRYDSRVNQTQLVNSWISKASATQRAGRTGRLRPVHAETKHEPRALV